MTSQLAMDVWPVGSRSRCGVGPAATLLGSALPVGRGMVGQGGPQRDNTRSARPAFRYPRAAAAACCAAAAVLCALGVWPGPSGGRAAEHSLEPPIELRLRMAWGAGSQRQWKGFLRVEGGQLSDLRDLGVAPDAAAAKYLDQDTLIIAQPSPTQYDGVEFTVRAAPDARVVTELKSIDAPDSVTRIETPLSEFIELYENRRLDDWDNRVLIRRAPGDVLRVRMDRDSLVFKPGEQFAFDVQPHLLQLEANVAVQLKLQLFKARDDRELWSQQLSLRSDAAGQLMVQGLQPVPLPAEEGAYDIVVSIFRRPRLGVPLWRVVPIAQRKIQLVAIDPTPPAPQQANATWQEVATIDQAHPKWRNWTARLTGWDKLPGFDHTKPLGSAQLEEVPMLSEKMHQLGPGQWQAYPIEVAHPEQPYLLEIEYPSHLAQSLGVSIIEPNANGEVTPIGIDSGIRVPHSQVDAPAEILRHRLVFWPRSSAPVVLLANQHAETEAYFGRIRLYHGPDRLPPSPLFSALEPKTVEFLRTEFAPRRESVDERLVAAYYDKPLFPANFGASEDFDETRQQGLDDWTRFYEAGRRLVEYLKYAGYNGAVVCVAREGSTIYPTQYLPSNPKYDSGIFFTTGQDVVRKDVLEMLFRLFDREGLQLVPAVSFSGRLTNIETLRRRGEPGPEGILLTDGRGRVATTQYNPLDARIQQVVLKATRELAERYGKHKSYAGLAVQLGPESFLSLPDEDWGLDERTFGRFLKTLPADSERPATTTPAQRAALIATPPLRRAWLTWRAAELASLFDELQKVVREPQNNARCYIATADLFQGRAAQRLLQPSLSSSASAALAEAALGTGLDCQLLRSQPGLVLLAPQRLATGLSLSERAVDMQVTSAGEVVFRDERPGGVASPAELSAEVGCLFFHEPHLQRLESFDEVSPFGPERTLTQLYTHAAPSDIYNRKRFVRALAAYDAPALIDGGWLLPLGQEESLWPLLVVYRQLPRAPFTLVAPKSESNTEPVVVRQWSQGRQNYFYLVNDSPWTARVTVELTAREAASLVPLSTPGMPAAELRNGRVVWTLTLGPYDLAAASLNEPEARVHDWQVVLAPHIVSELARKVRDVGVRADLALQRPPLKALVNPDFEAVAEGREIPGWQYKESPGVAVRLETALPHQGKAALHLHSSGEPLWIRSNAFRPPTTGRLYVLVRLRVKDRDQQPNLRVVLDDDQGFYWPLTVGGTASATSLPDSWREDYLFPFEQLPLKDLESLRLGFDLMGAGEVWIDDIQMFDMWLQRDERNALLRASGLADKNLERGEVRYCQHFLENFWAQFLLQHVPPPAPVASRSAALPRAPSSRTVGDLPNEPATGPKRSTMDRVRDFVPKVPIPFRR